MVEYRVSRPDETSYDTALSTSGQGDVSTAILRCLVDNTHPTNQKKINFGRPTGVASGGSGRHYRQHRPFQRLKKCRTKSRRRRSTR